MENKMYAHRAFKCSICDKEYGNAMDRARCELACGKKLEEEAKKAAEAKKKEEQMARKTKVNEAYELADKLRDEYIKDYGVYARHSKELTYIPSLEDIFNLFN